MLICQLKAGAEQTVIFSRLRIVGMCTSRAAVDLDPASCLAFEIGRHLDQ